MQRKLEQLLKKYDLNLNDEVIRKINKFLETKNNAPLMLADVVELLGGFDITVKEKLFTEAKYVNNTAFIDNSESQSLRVITLLNILAMNINGISASDNAKPELIQNKYDDLVFTNEIVNRNKFIKIMCEFIHEDLVLYSIKKYMNKEGDAKCI